MKRRAHSVNIATGPLATSHARGKQSSNRAFGLVFTAAFAVVAAWPALQGGGIRGWAAATAAAFAAATLFFPGSLAPLNRAWARLGILLGNVISPVALALVYYSTIVPIGLLMRLLGKDLLKLRFDRNAASYWLVRDPKARPDQSMKNQF